MMRPTGNSWLSLALIFLLLSVASGWAERPLTPVGEVSIELTGVAAGVGLSWGHGVLRFQGRRYPFRIEGLSVGDVGYAKVSAWGKVYNLKNGYDLSGTYGALGAGVALPAGVAGLTMQNQEASSLTFRPDRRE